MMALNIERELEAAKLIIFCVKFVDGWHKDLEQYLFSIYQVRFRHVTLGSYRQSS